MSPGADTGDGETRWIAHWLIQTLFGILILALGALLGVLWNEQRIHLRDLDSEVKELRAGEWLMCAQHRDLERLLRTPTARLETDCSMLLRRRKDTVDGP